MTIQYGKRYSSNTKNTAKNSNTNHLHFFISTKCSKKAFDLMLERVKKIHALIILYCPVIRKYFYPNIPWYKQNFFILFIKKLCALCICIIFPCTTYCFSIMKYYCLSL